MCNMKSTLKSVLFIIVTIFITGNTYAATHLLSKNCSSAAVNDLISAASKGDTIELACTGTVKWSSPVTLSNGKTIKGPGLKGKNGISGNWPLVIEVTLSGDAPLIQINNNKKQPLNRITGLKFKGAGKPDWIIRVEGQGTGKAGKGAFRIDNNYFDDAKYKSRLILTDGTTGKLTGLIDHNVFFATKPLYNNISYQNSYKGISTTCYGYDSLHRPAGFGTDDFVFYEDNFMFNSGIETSGGGGRVVVRYNEIASDFSNSSFWGLDGHGADTHGHNACGIVANEFYRNTVSGAKAFCQLVYMRGGKWRVYNNTTQSGELRIHEYRASGEPNCSSSLDWKTCSGNFCCPAIPAQCNIQCPSADDFAVCYPLPNQIQDTFLWNNIKSGNNMIPVIVNAGAVSTYIALNRDYFMPPYGSAASRPVTCKENTYYGASDTGQLWKCSKNSEWTLYYSPYVYPHPLNK